MAIDESTGDRKGAQSGDESSFHRRGFFLQGFRHLLRPLANLVEQRMQNLDPVFWDGLDEEATWGTGHGDSPYPLSSEHAPSAPPKYIRPPGALPEAEFLTRCTSSNRCVQACPVAAIRLVWSSDPRLNGKPSVDPEVQACVLCEDLSCMKTCPSGALRPLAREEIRMGVAVVRREQCLRASGEDCRICVDKCPVGSRAIELSYPGADLTVNRDGCTGCGVCQMHCPTHPRAIVVERRE